MKVTKSTLSKGIVTTGALVSFTGAVYGLTLSSANVILYSMALAAFTAVFYLASEMAFRGLR